jgi:alkaline phosphatase D
VCSSDLYSGTAQGGRFTTIDRMPGVARVGSGALRLDSGPGSGNATHVRVEHPPTGQSGNRVLTVTAWYRASDLSGDGSDARNFVWETYPDYSLAFGLRRVDGVLRAEWWCNGGEQGMLSGVDRSAVSPDQWHHVALVWNRVSRVVRFYQDGELREEKAIPDGAELVPMEGLRIGNHRAGNGERDWDGYIDDMAVYDVELSPAQVRALHAGEVGGREVHAGNVLERVIEPQWQRLVERPENPAIQLPAWHETKTQGPLLGHVTGTEAVVWARVPEPGRYRLVWAAAGGGGEGSVGVEAVASADFCLHFRLEGLKPATRYTYRIEGGKPEALPGSWGFTTAPPEDRPGRVVLGFGSCADFSDSKVWTRIGEEGVEGMVLLGDTPYIDITEIGRVRQAYRRFATIPRLVELFRGIPFWGTWDDHDFGKNDADGTLVGKEFTRQGFVEYRPNAGFGEEGQGVYTRFRRGPVEVFLLDTRWFARTGKSWADPEQPTLLGDRQWAWLRAGLKASTAPFKILACGMVWDDKKNTESDDWGTYDHERQALQRWLGEEGISGVILMGGDIHVSRLLRYPTRGQVGYELYQFIVSPLHSRTIASLNVPHPALLKSAVEPQVFLKVTADSTVEPAQLKAQWINQEGREIFSVQTDSAELSRKR